MKKFLVLLDNSNLIVSDKENLIEACKLYISNQDTVDELNVFRSFVFTEGTGYMRKVFEEIDFILQCNCNNTTFSSVQDFAANWKFTEYLNYDISSLSGGWRKFLGLALFTNITSKNKIYFDVCRHLADDLIILFKTNLDKTFTDNVFFFEYDTNIIRDASMFNLYYNNNKLQNDRINLLQGVFTDSNYEQLP
jgi:hypothetical protein